MTDFLTPEEQQAIKTWLARNKVSHIATGVSTNPQVSFNVWTFGNRAAAKRAIEDRQSEEKVDYVRRIGNRTRGRSHDLVRAYGMSVDRAIETGYAVRRSLDGKTGD